ncbi:Molybdopterin binding protein [Saccharata proteae CBS 121410]|uniref:Molybdopterin binding protein n=1 Tax=Saccharata proteae CBS 121410 TaxID=1314787 RepID=A0A9P4HNV8_9PEZI|nr:Molybdopterin binding protein [Saccharata proteae CBS 121410]
MFARLNQVARHLNRPLTNYAHRSAAASSRIGLVTSKISQTSSIMAATNAHGKSLIHTAACLIIGDEVLGGKTVDTNSAYMAKFCFNLGIQLKRIEVIADDEGEIVEAARRMSTNYDFVVTSGGIGPTHDDITYQSIAKAFNLPLILHDDAFQRMKKLSKPHPSQPNFKWDEDSPALKAKLRMIELPIDKHKDMSEQVVFVDDGLWVPVSVVNGNIHILPGVPRLFERMLDGLKPSLLPRLTDPEGKGVHRILFSTPMAESEVAGYLTELAGKVEPKGVKVGSYPRWGKTRNTVTLVGRDLEYMESLIPEVEKAVDGRRVKVEGEDDDPTEGEVVKPA